jgi:uncharacterized membrane protein
MIFNQSISQSINQSINQLINQLINQSFSVSIQSSHAIIRCLFFSLVVDVMMKLLVSTSLSLSPCASVRTPVELCPCLLVDGIFNRRFFTLCFSSCVLLLLYISVLLFLCRDVVMSYPL